ncbi:PEP/pyruvate-binding domain-containing protein [Pyrobaculum ferrireducens]|uniref:pyruvate, water dikinase n=1 Tax=Pyrobaculum ferrireducens TaxID=1104324 RepID=G7VHL1_9CREN|nr:PEP/pyruvate-binding domain-containing protein [Pyrobaculum ferrireducens]AET33302.1 Pyruvate, water dikinase [Pyrobaculum ferrireducens]
MIIVPISSLKKSDILLAGGKGASLGELVQAGARVPPGYVVTSIAYKNFLEYNGIDKLVARLERRDGDPYALAARIRSAILEGEMPGDLSRELDKVSNEFMRDFLAVRSSATYEDSPEFSFAGIHETYLGVRGADVESYVRRVWASNFEDRAVAYKLDNKIPPSKVLMAVVVQRLVNPKAAGVAFTLDPRNGDRSVVVVESSWGLGESVVAGEVNPDRYVVSKITEEVLKREISNGKNTMYVLEGGKVVHKEVPPELAAASSLEDGEVVEVARQAVMLEKYFGHPVDVEWAIERDVYILQSRPETVWSRRKTSGEWHSTGDLLKDIAYNLLSFKL